MEKLNTEERALARQIAAIRAKREAGKSITNREAILLLEANRLEGTGKGAMIEYWAAGPDRKSLPYEPQPKFCGQCIYLDLKPIDSGIRHCRKLLGWRWSFSEACDRGEQAIDLETAINRLTSTMSYALWAADPEHNDEIPF